MQDRGSASYLAEFLGTLLLVLFIGLAVSLFVQAPSQAQPNPFIDWSVIGLVHVFVLFLLIQTLAVVSGAHFNPAVTVAMATLRQIKPADAVIYIVAQFAGAVAGALLVKLLLNYFPNAEAVNYGAVGISDRLDGKLLLGVLVEMIGTFVLVFSIMGVAVDPRSDRALGPLVIGAALGVVRHGHRAAHRRRPQPGARVRARRSCPASSAARATSSSRSSWPRSWARSARRGSTSASSSRPARRDRRVWSRSAERRGRQRPVDSGRCAGSRSRATSRSRCRGRAGATASTARSPRTGRICTRPRRSSGCSTRRPAAGSRSCSCSPARSPRSTPRWRRGWRSTGTPTSSRTWPGRASAPSSAGCSRTRTSASARARSSSGCVR